MRNIGGICSTLARIGDAVLGRSTGMRMFPQSEFNFGGAAPRGGGSSGSHSWLIISNDCVDRFYDAEHWGWQKDNGAGSRVYEWRREHVVNTRYEGVLRHRNGSRRRPLGMHQNVKVDPRPLRADEWIHSVEDQHIVEVADSVSAVRSAILRSLGLSTVDALHVGQNRECPGIMVPSDDTLFDVHRTCPRKPFTVIAIALPRPGDSHIPTNQVYDRERMRAAHGYSAVRVIRTALGPGGSSVLVSDFVMARTESGWRFVRAVPLMDIE
jgi:hypothetical protein